MCGLGERDRRPIDPPPIVQLLVSDDEGHPVAEALRDSNYVVHASVRARDAFAQDSLLVCLSQLYSFDGATDVTICETANEEPVRALVGSLVASSYYLKDIDGKRGAFFVFGDLSARHEGVYRLKLTLFHFGSYDALCLPFAADAYTAFCNADLAARRRRLWPPQ